MVPEHFFANVRQRIRREWVICFFAALLIGLTAHFYKLVNWLPNWDALVFRYDAQDMTHFGRYFLSLVCGLSSYYELPWLNGLLCLLYLSLAAVCVCRMFSLRSNVAVILVGGLMAAFPTITSTMPYCYVADGYGLALLCACMAAMFLYEGGRKKQIATILLMIFSLGIYQAYITVTILLLLLALVHGLLFENDTAASSFRKALGYLVSGLLAGVGYFVLLQVFLLVRHDAINRDGALDISAYIRNIPHGIKESVLRFFSFFFDLSNGVSFWFAFNLLMFAGLIGLIWYAASRAGVFRSAGKTALLLLYLVAAPFGAAAFCFLPNSTCHNLMTMGFYVFYLFFILFYERLNDGTSQKFIARKNWGILLLTAAIIFDCVVIANVAYHKLQMAYNRSYGTAIRMADRIEQTDGALDCDKIAVMGILPGSEEFSSEISLNITGVTDGSLLRPDDYVVDQSVITATLNDYCSFDFTFAKVEERRELAQDPRVQAMPCWPENGSVAVIDGYVVLKLSEGVGLYD